ncbi:MAG TPA: hypothetical protein VI456_08930 [Polyangia bacterium]
MFLTLMVVGLVGLVMMAVPALGGHRHLGHIRAHGPGPAHGTSLAHHGGQAHAGHAHVQAARPGLRFIPSPRALFSVSALYGAYGNALVRAAHLTTTRAALLAIGPALLTEWLLIRPIWNLLFRFQGEASAPLEALIMSEAEAVVPFRNGRGIVSTVRDGRRVQLQARLSDGQAALPVKFGQRLRIEDVDARRECVTVSVISNDNPADSSAH